MGLTLFPGHHGYECKFEKTVPFKPNTAVAFLNFASGAHGADIPATTPETTKRYAYQFYISPEPVALAAFTGVVARIVNGPHEANRQDPHLPMRYDTGRPNSVIRLRISQPRTTSLPCPAGLRARRPSPMMDLYRKNAFSTRP